MTKARANGAALLPERGQMLAAPVAERGPGCPARPGRRGPECLQRPTELGSGCPARVRRVFRRNRIPRTIVLCLFGLLLQVASGTAAAAPVVTLKVKPLPIPGYPGTGDILGAGAEVESQVTISGTEYGGFPSPLTEITVYVPAGVTINSKGFATCAPSVLEQDGPEACPKRSAAGPPGEGVGVVSFAGERVQETVSIQAFFAPEGLDFYVDGSTPVSLQILERGYWAAASDPFDARFIADVPLIETVPGADDASAISFKVTVGAARRRGGKTDSYITLPKHCSRGGAPVKMELKFLSGETTAVTDMVPCPRSR
jgi:hypothetical protein